VLLHVERAPEPVCVVADRAQLGQVLVNLAVNARDAMPAGGDLTIASGRVELGELEAAASGWAPGWYARISEPDGEPLAHPDRDRPRGAASGSVSGLTVLVVEDEPQLRELLVEMLGSVSAKVLEADGAAEAIARADSHPGPIDALVTLGTSGRALALAVTERHPELRVLYISGYSDEEIAARGILAPEMSFLQKPFTVDELESKLWELLGETGAPA
jgi:CheY-like chemotaxis protein